MELKIKIESNWNGNYHLQYDGKYITLWGYDKNQPINQVINHGGEDEYEPVILVPVVLEIQNACPEIIKMDEGYIYIDTDGGDVSDEQIQEAMGDMNTPEAIKEWNECSEYIMKHKMTPNLDSPEY
jgi:hypothetical protein